MRNDFSAAGHSDRQPAAANAAVARPAESAAPRPRGTAAAAFDQTAGHRQGTGARGQGSRALAGEPGALAGEPGASAGEPRGVSHGMGSEVGGWGADSARRPGPAVAAQPEKKCRATATRPDLEPKPVPLVVGTMMERIRHREKQPRLPAVGHLVATPRRPNWPGQTGSTATQPPDGDGTSFPRTCNREARCLRASTRRAAPSSGPSGGWPRCWGRSSYSVSCPSPGGHLGLQAGPGWARGVLLLAGLQAVYVMWMFNAPDWATVRDRDVRVRRGGDRLRRG